MINLTTEEKLIADKILEEKKMAGSHSPSIRTLLKNIPSVQMRIDACFLSNPYATDLFFKYLNEDIISKNKLRDLLEYYPSQNNAIAKTIGKTIGVNSDCIFVGNGAIEVIQAVLHNFVDKKVVLNIPTFSSYYEFLNSHVETIFYKLDKIKNFELEVDEYIKFIKFNSPDTVILINPNNPDGGYIPLDKMKYILHELSEIPNIIVDESFIHFAYENENMDQISLTNYFSEFSNLILIKSMSKDFGVAGLRAGYGIMSKSKVAKLLINGYLWNSSGLSEYFFELYSEKYFQLEYNIARKKYITESKLFYDNLKSIQSIKTYPSFANFALVELIDGSTSSDFVNKLLINHGIYTRTGNDKIGLEGQFVRIASRTQTENDEILNCLNNIFN
jgi:histidinol-phosphate/aromatic aminotransferase/cobyric acid decarboxylase-like protein